MVLDIDKVCRLCLGISTNSIFYPGNSNSHANFLNESLISKIFECTTLKVATGDGLPESVCDACVSLMNKFCMFRKMCWEVDEKLHRYLFSPRDKNEQITAVNPVRLDPEEVERPCEAKDVWMCNSSDIKGERESSDEERMNETTGSDEEHHSHGKSSNSNDAKLKYGCNLCEDSFSRLSELKHHKEEEHPKSRKSKPLMTCRYCNKSFKQMKRYRDHVSSHEDSTDHVADQTIEDSDSDNVGDCERAEVKKEVQDENNENQAKGTGPKSKKQKVKKVYECEYCEQVFHSHAKFTQHELSHTGEKKYNCSDCSRSFTHKHSLIGHIREQHTGEVNFTCDVCGRGFVHQSTFIIHKKTHSTEKPLKCPDCEKCFTQLKNLRVHRQIHSASRSHTCQVCGKSFNFMKTLKVHLVLHSGEKPYVCTYCGKAFAQSAPLKTHTRIHTGEKPYQCTTCPLRFSTNNALKSHLLKHSGEAPYSCKVCSKGFNRKKDMVAHQEEMHEVFVGLPGHESTVGMQAMQAPLADTCLAAPTPTPTPASPLATHPLVSHPPPHTLLAAPHQTAPTQVPLSISLSLPPHHHPQVTLHMVSPLHPMPSQPSHPHYTPPQHQGADCSSG